MEATIDAGGRLLIPKRMRDSLGLTAGSIVDISERGGTVQITPGGRTARLTRSTTGRLVATSSTPVSDKEMFDLIDAGRR